jgi:hypothetical protein
VFCAKSNDQYLGVSKIKNLIGKNVSHSHDFELHLNKWRDRVKIESLVWYLRNFIKNSIEVLQGHR